MQTALKEIVQNHGGILTTKSLATHSVEPDFSGDQDEEEDYIRTLKREDHKALVHWWYYPDSYDNWINASDVEGDDPDDDTKKREFWRLNPRYLYDLEKFNEWMNEIDYEILDEDEDNEQAPSALSADEENKKRRRGGRQKKPVVPLDPSPLSKDPTPTKKAKQESITLPNTKITLKKPTIPIAPIHNGNSIEDSISPIPELSVQKVALSSLRKQPTQLSNISNLATTGIIHSQTYGGNISYKIPEHANWFSENEIHKIEKEAFPEFFTNVHPSKNPEV